MRKACKTTDPIAAAPDTKCKPGLQRLGLDDSGKGYLAIMFFAVLL